MTFTLPIILAGMLAFFYTVTLLWFTLGWLKLIRQKENGSAQLLNATVVIAARNEETNLPLLLKCLSNQDFSKEKFEVILVDDVSDDNTPDVISRFIKANDLKNFFYVRNDHLFPAGKKGALELGIATANNQIIITTDADCVMGPEWLRSMVGSFNQDSIKMVIGPVEIKNECHLFSKLQSLEFMSLTGSSGGSAAWGSPVMCNGANLAFRKETYLDVKENIHGKKYFSGDDIFLMLAIKKQDSGKVLYQMDRAAMVYTGASPDIRSFINQRIRWASKAGGYNDFVSVLVGATVALFNIIVAFSTILLFTGIFPVRVMVVLWIIKIIVDFPLIFFVSRFLEKTFLLKWYLPLQLVYPFYVSIVLFLSQFASFSWKDRTK
jgi:cellulose synthase/poly-beta-1,6-N-acetylglucosamine synthase-like glycosyltransferase